MEICAKRSLVAAVVLTAIFGFASAQSSPPPVPAEVNGQKVLVFVQQDPPGTRCNTNMQIAAEIMNVYQVPVVLMPQHSAPKFTPAPSVWYGGQAIAAAGAEHNGMVSHTIVSDQLEMEGAPKHDKTGKLLNISVRPGFEQLKDIIKTGK
jgi:hypothetical protein